MPSITATLPFPPSLNRAYRTHRGRILLSAEGRQYKNAATGLARMQHMDEPLSGSIAVTIEVMPPDRRRRDLDNMLKLLLDAMNGVLWGDDSQIDDLRIVRCERSKAGHVIIEARNQES